MARLLEELFGSCLSAQSPEIQSQTPPEDWDTDTHRRQDSVFYPRAITVVQCRICGKFRRQQGDPHRCISPDPGIDLNFDPGFEEEELDIQEYISQGQPVIIRSVWPQRSTWMQITILH